MSSGLIRSILWLWYINSNYVFSDSNCFNIFCILFFNWGKSYSIISQTTNKSIPKYSCIKIFLNPIIFSQSISLYIFFYSWVTLFADFPMISSLLPGGTFKSFSIVALFNILSFRNTIFCILLGSFFENCRLNIFSVLLHLNNLIIRIIYDVLR